MPPIYLRAFAAVDPSNTGETSVNALSRVLGSSNLPASTIDKVCQLSTYTTCRLIYCQIVSLVSSRTRVSKLEFFVALALVALAQSGKGNIDQTISSPVNTELMPQLLPELSVELVALLAQQNALPVPDIGLDSVLPSSSAFGQYQIGSDSARSPPQRGYSTAEDPWKITRQPSGTLSNVNGTSSLVHGSASSFSGTGLPKDWWKKQETVFVNILGQQGFMLNRYLVYEISSDVSRFLFLRRIYLTL